MLEQKRILTINDVSCVGKCSLTIALPVISALGIETNVLPTAILSTHTGGFQDFTFRDLTTDMLPIVKHWQTLDLQFSGIYSGYLGNVEQIHIVEQILNELKKEDTLIFIDPVMGDAGKLYSKFSEEFPKKMRTLCKRADVLIPNMTEACLLLNRPYLKSPYTQEDIDEILIALSALGAEIVCLTGISFTEKEIGAVMYDKKTGKRYEAFNKKISGFYHGTGDLFASILFGCIVQKMSLDVALQLAVDFTMESIARTQKAQTDTRFGVQFEPLLWKLGQTIFEK